jgi:hypothetical protein
LGTTPSAEKGSAPAASTASFGVFRGQLSGVINQHKTEAEGGVFEYFLSEIKGLLN